MKIILARNAGFCFGVERAVAIAGKALEGAGGPVTSLGPIIHNPQVVRELEEAGLAVSETLDGVRDGTIIIRSHGAPAALYEEAARRGLAVLDATCPFVKKMHELARGLASDGYQVVLCGESEHPEISSLLGDPGFFPLVVNDPGQLAGVSLGKKVALLAQTTQSPELFSQVALALLPRVRELRIHNTICDSTRQRQEESLAIARTVDVMIVIGGRNSANTRRLTELCSSTGTPTHHVEVPGELSSSWFAGAATVGVTAGASTPAKLIDGVVGAIKTLSPAEE